MDSQTKLPVPADQSKILESVLIRGDLSELSPGQLMSYYNALCESLGLNPLSRPFDSIVLSGKKVLYTKRDATDQLRKLHNVSIKIVGREKVGDVYVVTSQATMPNGRCDESTGAVSVAKLTSDGLANAIMKAETKSKRRVTLSICGLGALDETEIETIPHEREVDEKQDPTKISSDQGTFDESKAPNHLKRFFAVARGHNYSEVQQRDLIKRLFPAVKSRSELTAAQVETLVKAMVENSNNLSAAGLNGVGGKKDIESAASETARLDAREPGHR